MAGRDSSHEAAIFGRPPTLAAAAEGSGGGMGGGVQARGGVGRLGLGAAVPAAAAAAAAPNGATGSSPRFAGLAAAGGGSGGGGLGWRSSLRGEEPSPHEEVEEGPALVQLDAGVVAKQGLSWRERAAQQRKQREKQA